MITAKANGANMPSLGFGTWELRGEQATRLVERALEIGYRHIDTAAMYGNEKEVGNGIHNSSVPRDQVFVTTKIWPDHFAASDFREQAKKGVALLGLDHVDLLLLHWPSKSVPLAETMDALNEAQSAGLTTHIGISNFNMALMDEAVALSQTPIACNQVEYHPFLNQDRILNHCRKHGMAMTAYCPLARGKILDDPTIARIADAHGKNVAQITLRWLVQQKDVVAIPRTSNPDRAASNFDIFDFELSDQEMAELSGIGQPEGRIVNFITHAPDWD